MSFVFLGDLIFIGGVIALAIILSGMASLLYSLRESQH
jgi:hypothetical protein